MAEFRIHAYDLGEIVARSGGETETLTKAIAALPPVAPGGPWLAGGALRRQLLGEPPLVSDLDFFFASAEQAAKFVEDAKAKGCKVAHEANGAITLNLDHDRKQLKIQAVKIAYYTGPLELLDSFDFTICQFAYDGDKLYVGEHALWDLGRKRLAIHRVTYAAATARRFIKYANQGYLVCQGAIQKMLEAVAENPAVINSAVQYVD